MHFKSLMQTLGVLLLLLMGAVAIPILAMGGGVLLMIIIFGILAWFIYAAFHDANLRKKNVR